MNKKYDQIYSVLGIVKKSEQTSCTNFAYKAQQQWKRIKRMIRTRHATLVPSYLE